MSRTHPVGILTHYGFPRYSRHKFRDPINERGWIKPQGGLWLCPVASKHSWHRWCKAQEFRLHLLRPQLKTRYKVRKHARICTVDSIEDIDRLPLLPPAYQGHDHFARVDWQALAQDYDVFHLTGRGELVTRWIDRHSFYGWDCETVLVLNKAVLLPLRPKRQRLKFQ